MKEKDNEGRNFLIVVITFITIVFFLDSYNILKEDNYNEYLTGYYNYKCYDFYMKDGYIDIPKDKKKFCNQKSLVDYFECIEDIKEGVRTQLHMCLSNAWKNLEEKEY